MFKESCIVRHRTKAEAEMVANGMQDIALPGSTSGDTLAQSCRWADLVQTMDPR
jgi:hypothetical protein